MTGYVDALWVGPYGYRKAPEGLLLETGITVCSIPAGEANASDHWQPLAQPIPDGPGTAAPATTDTAEVS